LLRVETTSDGQNWHTVMTFPSASQGATLVDVDVQTEDVGSENFQLAFTFDGNSYNINDWHIDDVSIETGTSSGIGYVEGDVTLNGTSEYLITDVTISVGNYQSHPDEDGHFYIPTIPGNYTVSANMNGYETVIYENVGVDNNETIIVDFELNQLAIPQNLQATSVNSTVILEWEMGRMISQIQKNQNARNSRNLMGFNVYRDYAVIAEIINPNVMTFTDLAVEEFEEYSYFVTAVYENGDESFASEPVTIEVVDAENNELENVTKLNGNYPNPFNGSTTISFNLNDNVEDAELEIYNLKGQQVEIFTSHQIVNSPDQQIIWDAEEFASGIYFAKLVVAGKVINTKKMMLIK
ncbi:MAG: T9SS type A sorting domain-containing protein, partial [Candidatus Cloacimonetes bacterium]|nr:T9SS type A sorting domain-containing protein [Candidatus Cloacimonadota bacterium]